MTLNDDKCGLGMCACLVLQVLCLIVVENISDLGVFWSFLMRKYFRIFWPLCADGTEECSGVKSYNNI